MSARAISEWTDGVHRRSGTLLLAEGDRHPFDLKYPATKR
jgi:hypothetical protein